MTDEQTADEILSDARWERELSMERDPTTLRAAIVRALQAARTPPPGHIIDDSGVVRKLLGTLPVTKDGVVVCYEATELWHPVLEQMETMSGEPYSAWRNGMGKLTSECYSTPESAEAAKEAQ